MQRFAPDLETSRANFKRLAQENLRLQMETSQNRVANLVVRIKNLRREVRAGMKTDQNVRAEIEAVRTEMRNVANLAGEINAMRSQNATLQQQLNALRSQNQALTKASTNASMNQNNSGTTLMVGAKK